MEKRIFKNFKLSQKMVFFLAFHDLPTIFCPHQVFATFHKNYFPFLSKDVTARKVIHLHSDTN